MSRDMLFFIVGLIVSVVLSGPVIWFFSIVYYRAKRRISWASFFKKLSSPDLRAQIMVNNRKPDIIIGVNSGIVPAAILAFNFQIDTLRYLQCMPDYSTGDRETPAIDLSGLNVAGKEVLIVDDQYYSGGTLRDVLHAVKQLAGADPKRIRTFAVYAYDGPSHPVRLDIKNLGRVTGVLARVPWVFSDEIAHHYRERNRLQPKPEL